ncbi:CHASE2 domain-containing protein [Leptolyngbya ohadii]|uniref:CHASE2 domain-containing protein n=1 Tax=Leptolyngbya ohadii TaxID=1962290 RepID=UPI000B59CA99|nr:CHASE2 domain-containing protein [Leptolyngbya ohadii]
MALSPANYGRSLQNATQANRRKVRILAILGDAEEIDIESDRRFLEQLSQSKITFLVEPDRPTLNQQLWQGQWDVLFFAGHSSSQGQRQMQINSREYLTIEQLQYGLRAAIANGLKLAIFNSCDGLALARDLADLHLPQVIVMREPVPDFVAQAFLKSFLAAFSGGRSLYTSVRQAREQLQGWEDTFPCATWLPVICQNPAEVPSLWTDWCSSPPFTPPPLSCKDGQTILLRWLLATGLIAAVRWFGWLQPLELAAFDRLMQLRPPELPDPRLLVIRVTEADLQAEGQALRQGSLSDRTLSQLLQKIEQAQPRVIGLDLYRDFSASPELLPLLQSDRLVAICKRPDADADPTGVLPPPEVEESRLGFSDFVQDEDGAVRRHLFMSPNPASPCTASYALSTQLAFRYLYSLGITPQFMPTGDLQLGSVTFSLLHSRTSGYQPTDARGGQILLNYRAAPKQADIAQQVTAAQVLVGQVNAAAIKDRIVLIGVDAPSVGDRWSTSYGSGFQEQLPGVTMHAQMTSQILSTVLDRRPQLWVWSAWIEAIWIAVWAIIVSGLMWLFRRPFYRLGGIALCLLFITGFCFTLLLGGGWIPLVPATGAVLLGAVLSYYRSPFKG